MNSGELSKSSSAPTVLIVGTGPAGLFAACELVRHGVVPRIVELRPAPHHETRGTALQPAVLESIDRAGLIEPFLRGSVHVKRVQLIGPGLREIAASAFSDNGSKYGFQCSLPQWRTETILREHLKALGVEIEYGTEVKSIEDDPAGLRVTLDTDGRTEELTATYLLGAGGAHGVTRHSMQETLEGETYSGRFIVADLKARLTCPPECGRVFVGETGFVLFSPLPDDRWLIFVNRDAADTRSELPTEDELGALVKARVGIDAGVHDVRWVSYFKMHKRATARLADGRRFLVGDAGHLSSPMGGEGVNAALMDAADIAWKLALVVRGVARPVAARQLRGRTRTGRPARAGGVGRGSWLRDEAHRHVQGRRRTGPAAARPGRAQSVGAATADARRVVRRKRARRSGRRRRRRAFPREFVSRAGSAWTVRATIWSSSAGRRASTISASGGASSSRSSMRRARSSMPSRPAFRTAARSWCGRTVSSPSARLPPMKRP